ncbi:hypothetical protein N9B72_02285 [Bacteriovoracaceae bacterium]|nr:hypothetical protein [Bacteriovoracaceae bacterium]
MLSLNVFSKTVSINELKVIKLIETNVGHRVYFRYRAAGFKLKRSDKDYESKLMILKKSLKKPLRVVAKFDNKTMHLTSIFEDKNFKPYKSKQAESRAVYQRQLKEFQSYHDERKVAK